MFLPGLEAVQCWTKHIPCFIKGCSAQDLGCLGLRKWETAALGQALLLCTFVWAQHLWASGFSESLSFVGPLLSRRKPSRCIQMCEWVRAQSCSTLYNPMDCSPPGSSAHGILQARILSGLLCPFPGDLPDLGTKPISLVSPTLAGGIFATESPQKPICILFPKSLWTQNLILKYYHRPKINQERGGGMKGGCRWEVCR